MLLFLFFYGLTVPIPDMLPVPVPDVLPIPVPVVLPVPIPDVLSISSSLPVLFSPLYMKC
jgi:hypothetical protein